MHVSVSRDILVFIVQRYQRGLYKSLLHDPETAGQREEEVPGSEEGEAEKEAEGAPDVGDEGDPAVEKLLGLHPDVRGHQADQHNTWYRYSCTGF